MDCDRLIKKFSEQCRTCMKKESIYTKLQPIFVKSDTGKGVPIDIFAANDFIKKYLFTYLNIKYQDDYSQNVCPICMESITGIVAFFNKCDKSQKEMHSMLEPLRSRSVEKVFIDFDPVEFNEDEKDTLADDRIYTVGDAALNCSTEMKSTKHEKPAKTEIKLEYGSSDSENENHFDGIGEIGGDVEHQDYDSSSDDDKPLVKIIESEEEQEDMLCNICGDIFQKKRFLRKHMDDHIAENKRKFETEDPKIKKENGEPPAKKKFESNAKAIHKCHICQEKFVVFADLDEHMKDLHPTCRKHFCPICGRSFNNRSNRNTHMESHNKKGSFRCEICDLPFKGKVYLRKHMKNNHTEALPDHKCDQCGAKFNSTNKFEQHMNAHKNKYENKHNGVRPYVCDVCSKDFKRKESYVLHMRMHNGIKPYKCEHCGKDFIQKSTLNVHMRTHTGEKPYMCNICGLTFAFKGTMDIHVLRHNSEKLFECLVCKKQYHTKKPYDIHMKQHHSSERPFPCTYCDKTFATRDYARLHEKRHENKTYIKCDQCDKEFAQEDTIKYHLYREHNGPKPDLAKYTCEICDKSFKQISSLDTHMKTHAENRKYECNECGATFRIARYLQNHIDIIHLQNKPHACTECPKRYLYPAQLRQHITIHTGERPYVCPYCPKTYRAKKNLDKHIPNHTGEKPYKCKYCPESYKDQNILRNHLNTVHKDDILLNIADEIVSL